MEWANFRERLIWAREQSRFNYPIEVARAVGVNQATYVRWENGETKSTSRILELAKVLCVCPNWLKTGEGIPFEEKMQENSSGSQDIDLINDRLSVMERRISILENKVLLILENRLK